MTNSYLFSFVKVTEEGINRKKLVVFPKSDAKLRIFFETAKVF